MDTRNKVVVRYRDGRTLKGLTWDFIPMKEAFHVADAKDERQIAEVLIKDLKAVFFVRDFEGDPEHTPDYAPASLAKAPGLKLKVTFSDGEVLYGTTTSYSPARKGFFLLPADDGGNNERVFVVTESTSAVEQVKPGNEPAPTLARTSRS